MQIQRLVSECANHKVMIMYKVDDLLSCTCNDMCLSRFAVSMHNSTWFGADMHVVRLPSPGLSTHRVKRTIFSGLSFFFFLFFFFLFFPWFLNF